MAGECDLLGERDLDLLVRRRGESERDLRGRFLSVSLMRFPSNSVPSRRFSALCMSFRVANSTTPSPILSLWHWVKVTSPA